MFTHDPFIDEKQIKSIAKEHLVPIDLKIDVENRVIRDQFLWDANNTDCEVMRLFALQLLSEKLGRTDYGNTPQDIKRRFSQAVTEIICYNVNTYNRLKMGSFIGWITNLNDLSKQIAIVDGVETKQDLISPIVKVNLSLHDNNGELIEDSIYWDITCNFNIPEEFAKDYCRDLDLSHSHVKKISFSIRKQIFDHLKQVSLNKKYNLLKNLGIPINKEMCRIGAKTKDRDFIAGDRSDLSDNDMYIPK